MMRHKLCYILLIGWLATLPGVAGSPFIISEFLASNVSTLADEDGDFSDWIEIQNFSAAPASLNGYFLTDDPALLTKWAFPDVTIDPGRYLMVFASGKNRINPGGRLHTNFQLDETGEYLALIAPDGQTVVHQFTPAFPPQLADVSYGVVVSNKITSFVTNSAVARWLVPLDAALFTNGWAATNFDHLTWASGPTGIGFDAGSTNSLPPSAVTNLALGKMTVQSSTLGGFVSSVAVNGSYADFTHTAAGQSLPAYWEVNLGTNCAVERIVIYNRSDCCGSRLRDITVQILSSDGTATNYTSSLLNPENVLGNRTLSGPPSLTVNLTNLTGGLVGGGRVRITRTPDPDLSGTGNQGNTDEADVLSLAEVEVFGGSGSSLRPLIRTDVSAAMRNQNATALLRLPFTIPVEEMPQLDLLTLRMKYDDGFVAYLNGVEVARRNAPTNLAWNSTATAERDIASALAYEEIDLNPFMAQLQEGENVLAIQGLNIAATDNGFLVLPELIGKTWRSSADGYFTQPTPGQANTASFLGFVADTKFSVDRGFFSAPFAVAITSATPGAVIRYTTNGSPPSAVSGMLYTGPITIDRTTVLRAVATKPGYQPTEIDTQTYVFISNVITQNSAGALNGGFPNNWSGLAPDYDMDSRITGPNAAKMEGSLRSLPSLFITTSISNLFDANTGVYSHPTSGGVAWERPAALEMVDTNGTTEFHINCGLRIQGGYFRQAGVTQKHSFRVLFKDDYGPGKLRHDLFPGTEAVKEFDTFVLRAGANDGYAWSDAKDTEQFTRAQFGSELQLATGHPAPHGKFVHLYLNGLYWGLYHLIERPNEDFSSSYFGGAPEEWDANNAGDVKNGDLQAWNTFVAQVQQATTAAGYQMLQGNYPNGTRNNAYPVYLDKFNYIDYMLVNIWGGNWDWPNKNFWFGRQRTSDSTGFKFYAWDFENTMGNNRSRSPTNMVSPRSGTENSWVGIPHNYLKNNPEYRIDFADRVHKFFFNGGLLTPPVLTNRYRVLADWVESAIISETARWGDDNINPPQDQADWFRERDWILGTYLPVRSAIVLQQFKAAGLYPAVNAPVFGQHGGFVTNGFLLAMTHANGSGVILYTLDGTDPRLPGGATNSNARVYLDPVPMSINARVSARVLSGANWSALNAADFLLPGGLPLRVTEIMYHPPPPTPGEFAAGITNADDFEYLELRNISSSALNLIGASFVNGISFTFAGGSLAPGARTVLVKNYAAFTSRYGATAAVAGVFGGSLNNAGERLLLQDSAGNAILDFTYSDGWYPVTDGLGFSLVVMDDTASAAAWDSKANWRPSGTLLGSPGDADVAPVFPLVVINELLPRPGALPHAAIELANLGAQPADISGWWLSDDAKSPKKFRFPPDAVIPVGGFIVISENEFQPTSGTNGFVLSGSGGEIRLFSANAAGDLTGYYQGWDFGPTDEGVTLGRHVISTGADQFVPQVLPTLGATNAGPRIGPVVISEIMYHPPDLGTNDNAVDEYLELVNISTNTVLLYDPAAPTNTWRITGGVSFSFPTNLNLAPGERCLVINFDPVADPVTLGSFRQKYGFPDGLQILGPYSGKLNNSEDNVELKHPTLYASGFSDATIVDKVSYHDQIPWPGGADGFGASLQRIQLADYGNDPANWLAALPSAGGVLPVGQPPVLTAQPISQTMVETSNVTFTASVTGDGPFEYLWRFNGQTIATNTDGVLNLFNLQVSQQGNYSVAVLGVAGIAVSTNAYLAVLPLPRILTQPQGTNVLFGTNAILTVSATGSSPLAYQWQFNGTNLPGANAASLVITNVQIPNEGSYRVLVSDSVGTRLSDPAWVQPMKRVSFVQTLPGSLTTNAGADLTFTAAISAYPPPFTWQFKKLTPSLTYLQIVVTNATNQSFVLSNVQFTNASLYQITVSNLASPNGVSTFCNLTILSKPLITGQPTNRVVNASSNAVFAVSAVGTATLTYQWWFNETNLLAGATNVSLTVSNVLLGVNDGGYSVVVSNGYGTATSTVATLTVRQPAYIVQQPADTEVVAGANATLSVVAGGGEPYSYRWYFTNLVVGTNASLVLSNVQPAHAGGYQVVVTNELGAATSRVAQLTIGTGDADGNGLPDAWEALYGLGPGTDRNADPDGDGRSNWEEYISGTNPTNAASVLKITLNSTGGNGATVSFTAMPDMAYSILYQTNLAGTWLRLTNVAAQAGTNVIQVNDPTANARPTIYYRIATPPVQ